MDDYIESLESYLITDYNTMEYSLDSKLEDLYTEIAMESIIGDKASEISNKLKKSLEKFKLGKKKNNKMLMEEASNEVMESMEEIDNEDKATKSEKDKKKWNVVKYIAISLALFISSCLFAPKFIKYTSEKISSWQSKGNIKRLEKEEKIEYENLMADLDRLKKYLPNQEDSDPNSFNTAYDKIVSGKDEYLLGKINDFMKEQFELRKKKNPNLDFDTWLKQSEELAKGKGYNSYAASALRYLFY